MFENLTLTLAKKRCEWECNKTIISKNVCVFPFVKTSSYHRKVFVFKSNRIHICQTTIVEKHLRRYYVRMNSMSKSKSWQIMNHFGICGRDSGCKMVRFYGVLFTSTPILGYTLKSDKLKRKCSLKIQISVQN